MKSILKFLQPSLAKVLLLIFFLAVTSIVVINYQKTSKVSWQEIRGIPFSFVTFSRYEGPCQESAFCRDADIQNIDLFALVMDVGVWYLVSCIAVLGFKNVKLRETPQTDSIKQDDTVL